MDAIVWLRRDLRRADHPALLRAAEDGGRVLPLFVLDPALWDPAGPPRRAWLLRSLRALHERLDGALVVRHGDPVEVVPQVVAELGGRTPASVHVSADAGPYGRQRDDAVSAALEGAGSRLVRTGTPYAVGPGTIRKPDGSPYQVFTPFSRAWAEHGWPAPAAEPHGLRWARSVASQELPEEPDLRGRWTCRRSARRPRTSAGRRSSTVRWRSTATPGTGPPSTGRPGCRPT